MAHRVVLEATARRGGLAAVQVDRFGLAWAPGRGFELTQLQEWGPAASLLATGEHVQAALESAGYWLEAASLDALFTFDGRIRQVKAPVFLVRDPGSGRVGGARRALRCWARQCSRTGGRGCRRMWRAGCWKQRPRSVTSR